MIFPTTSSHRQAANWAAFGLLICAISMLFAYNFFYGERIQFNDGLGWDGNLYAQLARQDPIELLSSNSLSEYYLGRVLPPILVHYFSKVVGIDIATNLGVIRAFYIYNCICIALGAAALLDAARLRGWSALNAVTVVGLVFINYAVMKNMSYNPTLTDMTALAAACLLANAWSRQSLTGLITVGFFSSFVWPSFIFIMVPLIAMHGTRGYESLGKWLPSICAACIALIAVGGTVYAYRQGFRPMTHVNQVNESLFWLSAPIAAVFLFLIFRKFADPVYFLTVAKTLRVRNLLLAAALFTTVKFTTYLLANGEAGPLTLGNYIPLIVLGGMVNPGLNLVAHLSHYGPIIAIALILWSEIERHVRLRGPDLVVLFGVFGFLAIGTESRQFIPFVPFIGIVLGDILSERQDESWTGFWCFTAIALAISRFWFTINVGVWTGNLLEFPDQMLYMYTGPWMSNQMYVVFFWIAVLIVVGTYSTLRSSFARTPTTSTGEPA